MAGLTEMPLSFGALGRHRFKPSKRSSEIRPVRKLDQGPESQAVGIHADHRRDVLTWKSKEAANKLAPLPLRSLAINNRHELARRRF